MSVMRLRILLRLVTGWKGEGLEPRQQFRVPGEALVPGYNLVEVQAAEDITVNWVEISIPGLK